MGSYLALWYLRELRNNARGALLMEMNHCEHCGPVRRKTYPDPHGGTSWCRMCMEANGYPIPKPCPKKRTSSPATNSGRVCSVVITIDVSYADGKGQTHTTSLNVDCGQMADTTLTTALRSAASVISGRQRA